MNRITPEAIKKAVTPADYFKRNLPGLTIKKAAWQSGGLCPFHSDNNPGSFRINAENGAFKCFSCGSNGGDVIAFEQKLNNLSFPNALEKLAKDWGIL